MLTKKKLIEVALPLEKINAESSREKSIRHGHPSTLHLWWARRPLAAARAVIWASLVDDPSAHPEDFPTVEAQQKERERLFGILEKLVVWENSNSEEILNAAKAEIWKSTDGNPPELLDPFAGGGAIPLEAQRLGLTAHASDLNPVAVMINKAMIEIPPKFSGQPPVNSASAHLRTGTWKGAAGLADDVRYYGEWMKNEAFRRIGHLYPKVKIPQEQGGGEATVIAWIWARTVKCPNPACGCEMPLASSFVLSQKTGREAYLVLQTNDGRIGFIMRYGSNNKTELKGAEFGTKHKNDKEKGKKATFCCPVCKAGVVNGEYADDEANAGRMGVMPLAIVAEGSHGRIYLPFESGSARVLLDEVQNYYTAHQLDTEVPHAECRGTFASNAQGRIYGFREFKDYFTKRQLTALTTFSDLVGEAQRKAEADAVAAGLVNDHIPLSEGGTGARAYGEAVGVYLTFVIDKMADYHSAICSWHNSGEKVRSTFGRQAIAMTWDYTEANPFCASSGSYENMLEWVVKVVNTFTKGNQGEARQFDAQSDIGLRNIMISTDPPYYDNIGYADLSDFFYVWMRRTLKGTYPKLFRTMLVPKSEELVATPYRFEGSVEKARDFFEDGMFRTFCQVSEYTRDDIPVTIYYAFKQSETIDDEDEEGQQTASTGWETMLSAIIRAGFAITGTWPMRTEMSVRAIAMGSNALASSIVLVCRKRLENAATCTRREFVNALKRELKPALRDLQNANIAPVDMAQSAIGPGMGVFSHYKSVLEADGSPMSVRSALQIVNQEIDAFFNEQDGELDSGSRFCVDLYSQCAFNTMKYGEAQVLENAKGTSIASLVNHGALEAAKGNVRLKTREELPATVNPNEECIWLLTQQLTFEMDKKGGIDGCAKIVSSIRGGRAESAKALAYRLFTIADRKKWTQEAFAYNTLVIAWPEIQQRAAQMQVSAPAQIRMEL